MEASSPLIRENCWDWYTSVVKTRMHNDSAELIVFTRWHEEDLRGRIGKREKIDPPDTLGAVGTKRRRLAAAQFRSAENIAAHTGSTRRTEGEALWPQAHSAELLTAKRRLDPQRFECMYQGRPSSRDGLLYGSGFKTYHDLPAAVVRRANYTDTADTGDDFLCSVCYVVDTEGMIYITDMVYSRQPMEVTERP